MGIINDIVNSSENILGEASKDYQELSNVVANEFETIGGAYVSGVQWIAESTFSSGERPPREMIERAREDGFTYYDNIALDKACAVIGTIGFASSAGGFTLLMAATGGAGAAVLTGVGAAVGGACALSSAIQAYLKDTGEGCQKVTNIFIFVDWQNKRIATPAYCSASEAK